MVVCVKNNIYHFRNKNKTKNEKKKIPIGQTLKNFIKIILKCHEVKNKMAAAEWRAA